MNAAERLKAIIQERREWEAFGWGPHLAVWTVVLGLRMLVEWGTGPRVDLGLAAYVAILLAHIVLAWFSKAVSAARSWPMNGLWVLVAANGWFLGSFAPALGLLSPLAGAVLELFFLALGLTITGLLKTRRTLVFGGAALALGTLLLAVFPVLLPWRPALFILAFGIPTARILFRDRGTSPI